MCASSCIRLSIASKYKTLLVQGLEGPLLYLPSVEQPLYLRLEFPYQMQPSSLWLCLCQEAKVLLPLQYYKV